MVVVVAAMMMRITVVTVVMMRMTRVMREGRHGREGHSRSQQHRSENFFHHVRSPFNFVQRRRLAA